MRQGEVWMASLPISSGREQSGIRPAVVLQEEAYGQNSPLVLIALLTTQQAAMRFPAVVQIAPTHGNGLTQQSIAMVFQTRALDRSRFTRLLGTLDAADLKAVLDELRKLTGL